MNEKTPKFNEKITEVLKNARPEERTCQITGKKFVVRAEDIEFYKSMGIPLPIYCPEERLLQIITRFPSLEFFIRKSDLSGKETISNIDPESSLKIYTNEEWWSDEFDATSYGREYRQGESFFEQLYQLRLDVPQAALFSFKKPVGNNEFSQVFDSDNCYRAIGGHKLERVLYSNGCINCRDCVEIHRSTDCELCYQVIEGTRCYNSTFLDSCADCIDCNFCYDLRHCENCFGSNNLRHKKFVFLNKQLTREEYEKRMAGINLGSRQEQAYWLGQWQKTIPDAYRLNLSMNNTENCLGAQITGCKDCYSSTKVMNSENVNYSVFVVSSHDIFDAYGVVGAEMAIGSLGIIQTCNIKFSFDIVESNGVEYSEYCQNVENCFGCIGLKKKKFHIFNIAYSEEKYWEKVDEIKSDMLERGEYGCAQPAEKAMNAYNMSIANLVIPLTEEQAQQRGIRWYKKPIVAIPGALGEEDVPDVISDIEDDFAGKPIICSETGRPFSVVKAELDFYRRKNVPVPVKYQWHRWVSTVFRDQGLVFIDGECQNCRKKFVTQDYRNRKEKVICKECYDKIVEQY